MMPIARPLTSKTRPTEPENHLASRQFNYRELVLALVVLCSLTGCRSSIFKAEILPDELRVQPRINPRTIDLSRLAGSSVGNEIIATGDVLEITINAGLSEQDMVTFPVRVDEQGHASLPIIGNVQVVGLELQAAEAAIVATCIQRGLYTSPHVTATMKQRRINRVTVVGAVETPGTFELPRNASNLLAAVVAAEGLAEDAGEHVYLRVPRQSNLTIGAQTAGNSKLQAVGHSASASTTKSSPAAVGMDSQRINLTEVAEAGSRGFPVPDGGVVMVERRDPEPVQVLGLVNNPGTYEFPLGKDVRVLDAIAMAGGMSNGVADKIYVIRQVNGESNPAVIQLSFEKAKKSSFSNLRLQPTDVVSVEQTFSTILIDTLKTMNLGVGASLNALF